MTQELKNELQRKIKILEIKLRLRSHCKDASEAGDQVWCLRALPDEDKSLVLSAHTERSTTAWNPSSWETDAFFWLP